MSEVLRLMEFYRKWTLPNTEHLEVHVLKGVVSKSKIFKKENFVDNVMNFIMKME